MILGWKEDQGSISSQRAYYVHEQGWVRLSAGLFYPWLLEDEDGEEAAGMRACVGVNLPLLTHITTIPSLILIFLLHFTFSRATRVSGA